MKQQEKYTKSEGSLRLLARAYTHFSHVIEVAHEIQKTVFLGSYVNSVRYVNYLISSISANSGHKRTPKSIPKISKMVGGRDGAL